MEKIKKRAFTALAVLLLCIAVVGCDNESLEVIAADSSALTLSVASETASTETDETFAVVTIETTTVTTIETTIETTVYDESNSTIKFAFGGDVTLSGLFSDNIKWFGIEYPLGDVKPFLNNSDIVFFNLETSVGEGGETRKNEGFGFISPPENLEVLIYAGVDLVNCANNHIIDYGFDVFEQTLDNLDAYKIARCGIGRDISEAAAAAFIEKNGVTVGFLGMSAIVPYSDWRAGENNPGVLQLDFNDSESMEYILKCIKANDRLCDVLVINVHWGWEYEYYPDASQKAFARKMINAGADMIVGHHPHMLHGIEFYNDRPIFYSVGNFLFFKRDDEVGQTALFTVEYNKEYGFTGGKLIPMFTSLCKTSPVSGDMYETILENVKNRSYGMNTEFTDNGEFYALSANQ